MIDEKLRQMKEKSCMTCSEIAALSGIPEATVRKALSGATPDPRFETVQRMVEAMGCTLSELTENDGKKENDSETSHLYENRLRELHKNYAGYINSLKKDKAIIGIALGVVLLLVFAAVMVDILCGDVGWIRR